MIPVSPPMMKMKKNPMTNSSGEREADPSARGERRDPAEDLQPGGNGDEDAGRREEAHAQRRQSVANM